MNVVSVNVVLNVDSIGDEVIDVESVNAGPFKVDSFNIISYDDANVNRSVNNDPDTEVVLSKVDVTVGAVTVDGNSFDSVLLDDATDVDLSKVDLNDVVTVEGNSLSPVRSDSKGVKVGEVVSVETDSLNSLPFDDASVIDLSVNDSNSVAIWFSIEINSVNLNPVVSVVSCVLIRGFLKYVNFFGRLKLSGPIIWFTSISYSNPKINTVNEVIIGTINFIFIL